MVEETKPYVDIGNFRILGISHVSPESIDYINKNIDKFDIIAVELDRNRFYGLFSNERNNIMDYIRVFGVGSGIIFNLASFLQRYLGKKNGLFPGEEFKTAIILASTQGKTIALIDMPIEWTIKRLKDSIGFKDLIKSLLKRTKIKFSLSKIPDLKEVERILKIIKHNFPKIYHVIIDERNEFMADKLKKLHEIYPDKKILVLVGIGHVLGIKARLKKAIDQTIQQN